MLLVEKYFLAEAEEGGVEVILPCCEDVVL